MIRNLLAGENIRKYLLFVEIIRYYTIRKIICKRSLADQYPLRECRVACQQKCTRPKHIGESAKQQCWKKNININKLKSIRSLLYVHHCSPERIAYTSRILWFVGFFFHFGLVYFRKKTSFNELNPIYYYNYYVYIWTIFLTCKNSH